jgi:cytoskeletal protein CcmA (bactofilin family)
MSPDRHHRSAIATTNGSGQGHRMRLRTALRRHPRLALLLMLLAALLAWPAAGARGGTLDPVSQAWQQASAGGQGSYRFSSHIDQTLVPRAVPEMIGQGAQRMSLVMEGSVALPNQARLDLTLEGPGGAGRQVGLVQDGGRTFLESDGKLTPADGGAGLGQSGSDPLSYLQAAENVRPIARGAASEAAGGPALVGYSFEVNGAKLADLMRQELEARVAGKMPPGLRPNPAAARQQLRGHGEIWLDAAGLPRRQVLDMDLPGASPQYDVRMHAVTDYRDFGAVGPLPRAVAGAAGAWHLADPQAAGAGSGWLPDQILPTLEPLLPLAALALLVAAATLYFRRQQRRKLLYAALSIATCASLVGSPLLQTLATTRAMAHFNGALSQPAANTLAQALGGSAVAQAQEAGPAAESASDPAADPATGTVSAEPVAGEPGRIQASTDLERGPERRYLPVAVRDLPPVESAVAPGGESAAPPMGAASAALPSYARLLSEAQGSAATIAACGDGSLSADADGDGLVDQDEGCLGTDPYRTDTDGDLVSDREEVEGFSFGGRTWYGNPFNPSSSGDGLTDNVKWAPPLGVGNAIDLDADGTPNLWDLDIDADGVPNGRDLSPFVAGTLRSEPFQLSTQNGAYTGAQYIELQVAPQDPAHLRYSTSFLDWPLDEEGQITDLDASTEDLRLMPILRVETNVAPDAALASRYGVTVEDQSATSSLYPYRLIVPLSPIDEGGAISAFGAKVAYGPGQQADIRWRAKMAWMVSATLDSDVEGRADSPTPIQLYEEPGFRVTGLSVTKNGNVQMGVVTTPSTPNDDRRLFNLIHGLSATYLEYQNPALGSLAARFDPVLGVNTPAAQKWGVTGDVVFKTHDYTHLDEAMASFGVDVVAPILDAGYAASDHPTVALVHQSDTGIWTLDQLIGSPVPGAVSVNLAEAPLTTARALNLVMYGKSGGGWQPLRLADTLTQAATRYSDLGAGLTELRARDPNTLATTQELQAIIVGQYTSWHIGRIAVIREAGVVTVPDTAPDQEITDDIADGTDQTLGAYLAHSLALSVPGKHLIVGETLAGAYEYQRAAPRKAATKGVDLGTFMVMKQWLLSAADTREAGITIRAGKVVGNVAVIVIKGSRYWLAAQSAAATTRAVRLAAGIKAVTTTARFKMLSGIAGGVVLLASLAVIWYGFSEFANSSNPVVFNNALAYAIVSSVIAVALFALQVVPGANILVALVGLIDAILWLAGSDFSIMDTVTRGLTEFFYFADPATELKGADFRDPRSSILGAEGLVAGARLSLRAQFDGAMRLNGRGNGDDLNASTVAGNYHGAVDNSQQAASSDMNSGYTCVTADKQKNCANQAGVDYRLDAAGRDVKLFLKTQVDFVWRYTECGLGGAICTHSSANGTSPEKPSFEPLYVDVLPATLDGLWAFDPAPGTAGFVFNPDPDGDGLTTSAEATLGLTGSDWDSDDDGLSDGYERDVRALLGTDATVKDSDGDGITDAYEVARGSMAGRADADADGLADGAELLNPVVAGGATTWRGGWEVVLPSGRRVTAFSDPNTADADGDGVSDGTEKASGLSPYGFNGGPRFYANLTPYTEAAGGPAGAYLAPGGALSYALTLVNQSGRTVTGALTVCFPSLLTNLAGGAMVGSRQPAKTVSTGSCPDLIPGTIYSWDLTAVGGLRHNEQVSTFITGQAGNPPSDNLARLIVASVPFEGKAVTSESAVAVDLDDPTVTLSAPAAGQVLSGSDFVVGGTAHDASTWVASVAVTLPGAGTVTATGTDPWAATWSLPADGDYNISARSTDYAGRQSALRTVNVTVDNTDPTLTLAALADDPYIRAASTGGTTVHLSGTLADNHSGISRARISIDGRPFTALTLSNLNRTPYPTAANWSYDWQLPGGSAAQGKHEIRLLAWDRADNRSTPIEKQLIVDVVPATDALTDTSYATDPPDRKTGAALALQGLANDGGNVPLPANPKDLVGQRDAIADATVWLQPDLVADATGGRTVNWLGDVDGDRLADLAIGLPGAAAGAGRLAIVHGRPGGWPVPPDKLLLSGGRASFIGEAGAAVGGRVAAAGDVNGDGLSDFLVGDSAHQRVFLEFGRTAAIGAEVLLDGAQAPTASLLIGPAGLTLGGSLAAAGDVNGDGIDDLLLGGTDGSGSRIYLLLGRAGVWSSSLDVSREAAAVIAMNPAGAAFSGVGDVNGDNLADFAVGDPTNATGGSAGAGVVLFLGAASFTARQNRSLNPAVGTGGNAAARFGGTAAGSKLAALGDMNGDGKADFIYNSGTKPRLVLGRSSGAWSHTLELNLSPAADGFLAAVGNVDGDAAGLADLLVGSANSSAYLLLGANTLSAANPPSLRATLTGVVGAASAPYAAGADAASDGSSDLLLVPDPAAVGQLAESDQPFGTMPHVDVGALPVADAASGEPASFTNGPAAKAVQAHLARTAALVRSADPSARRASADAAAAPVAAPAAVLTRYVDDDWASTPNGINPDGPGGATSMGTDGFATIQAAVNAAGPGDIVRVLPGVYDGFEVGGGKNGLFVGAANADTAFVNGHDFSGTTASVYVHDVIGVTVSDLTLRNAQRGVWLANAGAGGYDSPVAGYGDDTLRIALARLAVVGVGTGLYTDRISSVELADSTLVTPSGASDRHISVGTTPDPELVTAWSTAPTDLPVSVGNGGGLVFAGGRVHVFRGNGLAESRAYDLGLNGWSSQPAAPVGFGPGSAFGTTEPASSAIHAVVRNQRWLPLASGEIGPPNSHIYALLTVGDEIYAGGSFASPFDSRVLNVARWDTVDGAWEPLGRGVTDTGGAGLVQSLTVDGSGNIYVGGSFNRAINPDGSQVTVGNIARWNGSSWSNLGGGANAEVRALAASGSTVFAGGSFDSISGVGAKAIARWSGTAWSAMSTGLTRVDSQGATVPGVVNDFLVSGSDLYIGGLFSNTPTANLARWNGSTLNVVGSGQPFSAGGVKGLAFQASDLYASGCSSFGLQRLRGGAWSNVTPGGGDNGEGSMETIDGKIYRMNADCAVTNGVRVFDGSSWSTLGTTNGKTRAIAEHFPYLHVGGDFTQVTNVDGEAIGASYFAQVGPRGVHYRRNLPGSSWERVGFTPHIPSPGSAMATDSSGGIYTAFGSGPGFQRWNGSSWVARADTPDTAYEGTALAWAAPYVYAFLGDTTPGNHSAGFYRYDPTANSWTTRASVPLDLAGGAALVHDGGDYLYARQGGNGAGFARYRIASNTWETLPDAPFTSGAGGGLVRVGQLVYGTRGLDGSGFDRYGPLGIAPVKLHLHNNAFVAPKAASAATWLNTDFFDAAGQPPEDYGIEGSGNQWVASPGIAWTPASGAAPVTLSQVAFDTAKFQDPTRGLYRITEPAALSAGYHRPVAADVYVVPSADCDRCGPSGDLTIGVNAFTSIQAAINSGALRVLVTPGLYAESMALASGVQVIGAGADETVIRPRSGAPIGSAIFSAEGIVDGMVARVGLDGQDSVNGVGAQDGAQNLLVARNLVHDSLVGVAILGATTQVEAFNNTLVNNIGGLRGASCASVDVRNTVFAFNSGTALAYESCAATKLHSFNLFWNPSGTNLKIGTVASGDLGAGELVAEPRFVDAAALDFRPADDSPLLAAGDPTDPVPPGATRRTDIGYLQLARAAYYADHDYCESCLNDGLSWNVDAFDTIQAAATAAGNTLRAIGCGEAADADGLCGVSYAVGVAAGTYPERVTLTSHVRLIGLDPATTKIDAQGTGSPVKVTNQSHVEVKGFTLTRAASNAANAGVALLGATSAVTVTRNILLANLVGVRLASGASGVLRQNTFVDNLQSSVLATDAGSWATVRDNILTGTIQPAQSGALRTSTGGQLFSDYNLLFNNLKHYDDAAATGLAKGPHDQVGVDPRFVNATAGNYNLQPASPAVDAADPALTPPPGGAAVADIGYKELLAVPLTLLFGKQGISTASGNSGIDRVEVALVKVSDLTSPVTSTLPAAGAWNQATLTAAGQPSTLWTKSFTPGAGDGLYRIYSRVTDVVGNLITDPTKQFRGAFHGDSAAPTVTLLAPTVTTTAQAAIELKAKASDFVTTAAGSEYSVAKVYFVVDGAEVPAEWTADPPDANGARTFHAWLGLTSGAHTIVAKADDRAGNTGAAPASGSHGLTASSAVHIATITSLGNGTISRANPTTVSGWARFTTTTGVPSVDLRLDVAPFSPPAVVTIDDPTALLTTWHATVNLPPGTHVMDAQAQRDNSGNSNSPTQVPVFFDATAPSLAVTTPASGTSVQHTVTFSGTASDAGSGLAAVAVSLDGGYEYLPATISGGSWSLAWSTPLDLDRSLLPLHVRALDKAGNETLNVRELAVDNRPPVGFAPVTFQDAADSLAIPEGSHLDAATSLRVAWSPPQDGSAPVVVRSLVDHAPTSEPTTALASGATSLTADLNANGSWYVHLSFTDTAGNKTVLHYGPWHVGAYLGGSLLQNLATRLGGARPATVDWAQSILIDGKLDLAHDEWRQDREFLDDDERPVGVTTNEVQALYGTWDAERLYLGWQGAQWHLDGSLFAYLDVASGGTTAPLTDASATGVPALAGKTLGAATLPFAADYFVLVTAPGAGQLWKWGGSAWALDTTTAATILHGDTGGTEIRLPFGADHSSGVKLLAFGVTDATGAVWTLMPTANPLAGPWPHPFQWGDLQPDLEPNADQPQGKAVDLALSSRQDPAAANGPASQLVYDIDLTNHEASVLAGLQLDLGASAGLGLSAVTGASCQGLCLAGGNHWVLNLPPLAANGTTRVTITATIDSLGDLDDLNEVSLAVDLKLPALALPLIAHQALAHRLDRSGPTVVVDPLQAVRSGSNRVTGTADDGVGGGVARVRARIAGGSWVDATGTTSWEVDLTVTGTGTQTIEVQAFDAFDTAGPTVSRQVLVDSVGPTASLSLPSFVAGLFAAVQGSATDPSPAGGLIQRVEIQLDDETALPEPASVPHALGDGSYGWLFTWRLPNEDGVTHRMRARAVDEAGNVGAWSSWASTVVFATSPLIATATSAAVEGSTTTFGGRLFGFAESGDYLVTWSFGDGTQSQQTIALDAGAEVELSMSHVYADSGSAPVQVLAGIGDTALETGFALEVANAAPSVSNPTTGTVYEGLPMSLTAAFHDPGTLDSHTGTVVWGDGTPPTAATITETPFGPPGSLAGLDGSLAAGHTYADNQSYSVATCVADDDAPSTPGCATTPLLVRNNPPVTEAGADLQGFEDDLLQLSPATFVDPGTGLHSATVSWGDDTGTASATVNESGHDGGTVSLPTHAYASPGRYTVTVCVTDDEPLTACDTRQVTVVHAGLQFGAYALDVGDSMSAYGSSTVLGGGIGARGRVVTKLGAKVTGSVLSTADGVIVDKNVIVEGPVESNKAATLYDLSLVRGNVTAGTDVTLKTKAKVEGNVKAGGKITLAADSVITGSQQQYASVPPRAPTTDIPLFTVAVGSQDVTVPAGGSQSLAPGSYRNVTVGAGATLGLQAGHYAFTSLIVNTNGRLLLNLDPDGNQVADGLLIDVHTTVDLLDGTQMSVISAVGGPEQVLLRSAGTKLILRKTGLFLGTFVAPRAAVELRDGSQLAGALYGKTVQLYGGSTLTWRPALDLFATWMIADGGGSLLGSDLPVEGQPALEDPAPEVVPEVVPPSEVQMGVAPQQDR